MVCVCVCVCAAIKQIHVRDVYLVAKLVGEKAMESEVTERITVNNKGGEIVLNTSGCIWST